MWVVVGIILLINCVAIIISNSIVESTVPSGTIVGTLTDSKFAATKFTYLGVFNRITTGGSIFAVNDINQLITTWNNPPALGIYRPLLLAISGFRLDLGYIAVTIVSPSSTIVGDPASVIEVPLGV